MIDTFDSINEPHAVSNPSDTPVSINEPPPLAPNITSLDPDTAAIGDPSFTLTISGDGFYNGSVIVFAGQDEPTTYVDNASTVSTQINMDYWHGADTLDVQVRNGPNVSNTLQFTFTGSVADPDELEEELDAAREDGDFKSTHPRRRHTSSHPAHRRKK